jgi:hypothetical protein
MPFTYEQDKTIPRRTRFTRSCRSCRRAASVASSFATYKDPCTYMMHGDDIVCAQLSGQWLGVLLPKGLRSSRRTLPRRCRRRRLTVEAGVCEPEWAKQSSHDSRAATTATFTPTLAICF